MNKQLVLITFKGSETGTYLVELISEKIIKENYGTFLNVSIIESIKLIGISSVLSCD